MMNVVTTSRNGNTTVSTTQMNETSNPNNGEGGLGFSQYGNNNSDMRFIDIDGVSSTRNSSSADLVLPSGTNTIKFARLYWGGRINTSVITSAPDTLRKIKIRKGSGSYSALTTASSNVISVNDQFGANSNSKIYESFIDITSFLNSNGAGTYTIADIPLTTGSSTGGQYGGWAIAVAYENTSLPYNSIRMYDGFAEVYNGGGGNIGSLNLVLSGLNVPSTPLLANEAVMGAISWEGDADLAATSSNPNGDFIKVNNITVSNAVNPATNFWNGSISRNGNFVTTKNPNYSNQMGIDIDEINVGTGYNIQPNATSVNIQFGTEADQYFPSVFTFCIRVKDPTITLNKSVTDANNSGYVDANEILTYTLSGTNQGSGSSYNSYIVDTLPSNATYVPGSLEFINVPGVTAGIKTDAIDSDEAFKSTNGGSTYLKFFIGSGATGSSGGELMPGSSGDFSVRFKVRAAADPSTIVNTARIYGSSVVGDPFNDDATATLTANFSTNLVETQTACDSYTWRGTTYNQSGKYTYDYLNSANFPSTDTLYLTINNGTFNSQSASACESYTWNRDGKTYNATGNYTYGYTNGSGCPSVDTLRLTITKPAAPTGLLCYQSATFNSSTCSWDVTGTQPAQPTLACYETATFNTTSCEWDVTGTQPAAPTGLACYESASFNTTSCSWDVTGTQPAAPTGLACYESASFNTTSCSWDVTGTQPAAPTGLACYESASFNTTSCSWDVTGTQPAAPTGLACYESASFNTTSCSWDVTGTQPAAPTGLACYESASFNTTSCSWDVTGTQPAAPTGLACYESASFNTTSCSWDVTGEQDPAPTGLACYQTASFNTTTCSWDVTGTKPEQPTLAPNETAIFNAAICQWVVEEGGPLPVSITKLSAKLKDKNFTTIDWSTQSEINLRHYDVERSEDGVRFSKRGVVNAKRASANNYNLVDNIAGVRSSVVYYRLKAVDNDGTSKYSSVVSVKLNGSNNIQVYPNPFIAEINVNLSSSVNEPAKIRLYTPDGKLVAQQVNQLTIGENKIVLKNLNRLTRQNYILRIERSSGVEVMKVLKSLD